MKNKDDYDLYYEPFVGGANVIDKVPMKLKIGSDINHYLIDLLQYLQSDDPLPEVGSINKDIYMDVMKNPDNYLNWYVAYVGFNSYGGAWFNGYRNDKNGRNYWQEHNNNLTKQRSKLKDIQFYVRDYLNANLINKAIIYCDPPYRGTKGYCNNVNYDEFYDWCIKMSKDGHLVYISEFSMPEDRFECIWELDTIKSIHHSYRKTNVERLWRVK